MTAASLHTINRREGPSGATRRRSRAALAALAGFAAFAAQVALAQGGTRLEKVELQPQPGEQLEVRLVLDGPAPQPVTFTIDNPARLAVDLPGTTLALDSRRIDVKAGGVDTIVAAEASGRTAAAVKSAAAAPASSSIANDRPAPSRRAGSPAPATTSRAAPQKPAKACQSAASPDQCAWWSSSTFVTSATSGCRRRKLPSLSSASATITPPVPQPAFAAAPPTPAPNSSPPRMKVGSAPVRSRA